MDYIIIFLLFLLAYAVIAGAVEKKVKRDKVLEEQQRRHYDEAMRQYKQAIKHPPAGEEAQRKQVAAERAELEELRADLADQREAIRDQWEELGACQDWREERSALEERCRDLSEQLAFDPVIITPWGQYRRDDLKKMARDAGDGRLEVRLEPPAPGDPPALPAPALEAWRPGARPGQIWLGHYDEPDAAEALLPADATREHALVVGGTGTGKTRLLLLVASELLAAGCSVVALDTKASTLAGLAALARQAGVQRETWFVPSRGTGPAWNPLLEEGPALQRAELLLEGIQELVGARGQESRMWDILRSALVVLAARRLSLYELAPLLTDDAYRKGLLRFTPDPEDADAWRVAARFFEAEYGAWDARKREEAAGPALNKVRRLLMSRFFVQTVCGETNELPLGSLWREPQLALFHLDMAEGQDVARTLGTLAARRLFQAALRPAGKVPVVVVADEAALLEELAGDGPRRSFGYTREAGLRLLLACQHLSQLSGGLRDAAVNNAGLACFLRCGEDDARRFPDPEAREWLPKLFKRTAAVHVAGRPRCSFVKVAAVPDPPALPPWQGGTGPDVAAARDARIAETAGPANPRLDGPAWGDDDTLSLS